MHIIRAKKMYTNKIKDLTMYVFSRTIIIVSLRNLIVWRLSFDMIRFENIVKVNYLLCIQKQHCSGIEIARQPTAFIRYHLRNVGGKNLFLNKQKYLKNQIINDSISTLQNKRHIFDYFSVNDFVSLFFLCRRNNR